MHRSITLAAAFTAWVGMAHADAFTDTVVSNLQELGYEFIEIQAGINQVKVEAIRGTEKLEVIYDRASGSILKQENEVAEDDEVGRTGVKIRIRNRDFLDDDEMKGDDDEGDDKNDEDDDENDEDDDENDDDDDDDDDNEGSGSSGSGHGGEGKN
jgi:hypothetical protein